ncbi:hypothetical protein D9M68_776200 [compost metagenome]
MHHLLTVRMIQRGGHLFADAEHGGHRQQVASAGERHKITTGQEFHGDEGQIVLFTGIKDGDDVGVLQPARRLGLAEEAFAHIDQFGAFEFGTERKRLDRHRAADLGISALVDHAHGAFAELFLDPVAA